LREVVSAAGPGSIGSALRLAFTSGLIDPDPRLVAYLDPQGDGTGADLSEDVANVVDAFMQCDVAEFPGYFKYVEDQSPYSTQHGTKGAEFPKVLVVLDDNEGAWNMYSYEKLLGLRALSATDKDHRANGRDSVVERSRRLLYVCVSRATDALAVVLFTTDVDAAIQALKNSGLSGGNRILTLDAI
jgi:DNA helicase II / ATP-dependent DNA helicase PcrA